MSWVRAVWREDSQEEGVIPKIWVQNKFVRWPTCLNVKRAFTEMLEPADKWFYFPLIKIKVTGLLYKTRLSFSKSYSELHTFVIFS